MPFARRTWIAAVGAGVIALGLLVHFTMGGAGADFLADSLYAVLIYLIVTFVVPSFRPLTVTAVAFAICAVIELLQLSGVPAALGEVFPPTRLVLGTTYAAVDILAYALGVTGALACELLLRARRPRRNDH
jgi:hypothetical protein